MAKSRQQRRARRAQQAASGDARAVERPRAGRREAAPAEPARREAAPERPRRGSFVRESAGELRKVEWPNRAQVTAGTIVVVILCALVGAYLWIADLAFRNLVEKVLI